jgi:hypothetical protein
MKKAVASQKAGSNLPLSRQMNANAISNGTSKIAFLTM